MNKVLHILTVEPDDTVAGFIQALCGDESAFVVGLYPDRISATQVNWSRLVDEIFGHEWAICW